MPLENFEPEHDAALLQGGRRYPSRIHYTSPRMEEAVDPTGELRGGASGFLYGRLLGKARIKSPMTNG